MKGKPILLAVFINADFSRQPVEYMKVEDTYSPAIHRINKAVRDRASNPKGEVAPPADVLMQWSKPPAELVSKTTAELQKLTEAANIKKGNTLPTRIRIPKLTLCSTCQGKGQKIEFREESPPVWIGR